MPIISGLTMEQEHYIFQLGILQVLPVCPLMQQVSQQVKSTCICLRRFLQVPASFLNASFVSVVVLHGAGGDYLGPDQNEGEDHVGPEHNKRV